MTNAERQNNLDFLKETVDYLESKGYEGIKAPIEGYDSPKSYYKKNSDVVITPDIVAERAGVKHYFELGLKSDETQLLKSKWQFLDTLSQMRNQRFHVVTRRGHYRFTDDLLRELNIDKEPIRI